MTRLRFTPVLILSSALLLLSACGGGSTSSDSSGSATNTRSVSSNEATLTSSSQERVASSEPTGSISLEWVAPVARSDGSALQLTDIGGFRIYYGESKGDYPNYVDIPDSSVQRITLKDLPAGSYFIVMTTYDVSNLESSYSSPVKKATS